MKNKSPAVVRKWKRIMGVSCSHGALICPKAEEAVIRFRQRWKPDVMMHLGDFIDTAAFMGHASDKNKSEPIAPDIVRGFQFLQDLGVTHCTMGNHDERPYRYMNAKNELVAYAACQAVEHIETNMKRLGIQWINSWSIRSYFEIGGYKWMHGYMYNVNACRDHAEAHGSCVFGHTHTAAVAKGRRDDFPTAFNIGTLTRVANMDYAKARRQTLAWSGGFVFGEYCGNEAQLWLHENKQNQEWILPL